jgi:hypothetical protein
MTNTSNEPDPRRWMQRLQTPTSREVERPPAKQTMMARVSGIFRSKKTVPLMLPTLPNAAPPPPPSRPLLPGEIAQQTFQVPRCRSVMTAGECVENPAMEIMIVLRRVGSSVGLVFSWKDANSPDDVWQKTEFSEEEGYVRSIYDMVVRERHAPRKLAEEIARARQRGQAESDGVLKALVDMETKRGWQAVYGN